MDLNLDHGLGVEAEGRWQRFYEFKGIRRDNYLIGPRMQIRPFWRTRPYLKVLVGVTDMSFGTFGGTGGSVPSRLEAALIFIWAAKLSFVSLTRNTSVKNGLLLWDRIRCHTESALASPIAFSSGIKLRCRLSDGSVF